jgi:aryl-alcohol dehydrogenase-like predicted oxidoreductase
MPGTTKLHRLERNIQAAQVSLSPSDLTDIDTALSQIEVQGDRYSPDRQKLVGR